MIPPTSAAVRVDRLGGVRILGLVFAGSATDHRDEMTAFVGDVLGMTRAHDSGVEADLFALPDGSRFGVANPRGMGDTSRTIGFLVDDLEAAAAELRAAGAWVADEAGANDLERYLHFRAPDGELYELVERG
jgi:catechol 2,3-dioxygenase-like lactoylglutathione lyase family enzyme